MTTHYKCKCHPYSPFHWNRPDYPQHIQWGRVQLAANNGQSSSETVNRKRAEGIDIATIPGLSNRKNTYQLNPKQFHVYSKASAPKGKK